MADTTAQAVANYIIHFCHEHGDGLTNLHLQKLVYYAQAWYLALYDKPLFDEDLQAWASGPVQPELYERFKKFKWNPISEDGGKVELPQQVEEHLQEVMEVYGKYNAFYLERMTQQEDPWLKARGKTPRDEHSTAIISRKNMQDFYKALADGEEDKAEAA